MHRVDTVGNSLGVRQELAKGIGSLPGWCKGVCQKKIETRRKIVGGSRKAYQEDWEARWKHVEKLPEEDHMTYRKNTEVSDGCTTTAQAFERLTHWAVEPLVPSGYFQRLTRLGPTGKSPIPWCSGS
ncbi:hypothetical protein GW17_00027513 [Ensete ventricosum]|nr:hypothetical protein GW17_00027513 [Ensete ventricosum]